MRKRRRLIPGAIHFITFRTQEGLPFVTLPFMNMLILSAFARAKIKHPVQIVGVTVEANHVHLIIRVIDPVQASQFIGYFKTETSTCLNRLLGRTQRTVWEARFDSPVILDFPKALQVFSYAILNPVKDGLVSSMGDYGGVSSFNFLKSGTREIRVKNIPRNKFPTLQDPSAPYREDRKLTQYLSSDEFTSIPLVLEPEAMRLAYPQTKNMSPAEFRLLLLKELEQQSLKFLKERSGRLPLGPLALSRASMLQPHTPPTSGRKSVCLSSDEAVSRAYRADFRQVSKDCDEVFEKWKAGDLSVPFPPGMFAPHPPRLANFLPSAVL